MGRQTNLCSTSRVWELHVSSYITIMLLSRVEVSPFSVTSTAGIQITVDPREADIPEGGMGRSTFTRTGYSFGPIPFRVLPLTYDEVVARGFDIDTIYPMRPIAADAGMTLHIEWS